MKSFLSILLALPLVVSCGEEKNTESNKAPAQISESADGSTGDQETEKDTSPQGDVVTENENEQDSGVSALFQKLGQNFPVLLVAGNLYLSRLDDKPELKALGQDTLSLLSQYQGAIFDLNQDFAPVQQAALQLIAKHKVLVQDQNHVDALNEAEKTLQQQDVNALRRSVADGTMLQQLLVKFGQGSTESIAMVAILTQFIGGTDSI